MQLQKPVTHPKEEKKEEVKEITLPEKMTIRELADKMKMQPSVIVKKLFMEGVMVTVNHEIDFEKAQEIAMDYDIIAEQEEKVDVIEELLREEEEPEDTLVTRPPVVCVMGHVDHGKTSLLDYIRKSHVTDREAGGITQHIGAYMVSVGGQKITFLDTPGHEAFTAMRMRGANATDIAILVVAADDGVMPQTVEAINHAKAAGVEIIVAINKIDKPSANIERVKQELSEYELIPEDWGGSTVFAPVSAHTGEGIDNLLEMILLTAEVSELKANPNRKARGLVIEAELDKGKGPVATILVQKGTLKVGDFIAAGACSGRVRAMIDDKGRRVKEAGPSTPVEILGLSDVPNAGEILVVTDNDKEAKNFAATFVSENKNRLLEETKAKMSLDDLFSQIQAGNLKELPLIVKADVQGSVEAVKQSLVKLSNEEVVVKVIHGGVGAINESDVTLASASNAIIIGFNVRPDATAKSVAEQEGVDLRLYRVIYQAIEDVEAAMKGMLDPVFEEKVLGHAEVRQIFKASGVGNIAGSYVLDGVFQRNCQVRITRDGEQIFEGALASLKRFKDDVKEVKAGYECGLVFEDFNDIKEEDRVEAYTMVEVPR
ncbi:translation initiation factor IF-2 [Blautia sp.]|nr:translation initiation factor IF-2 [Blautia sp.]